MACGWFRLVFRGLAELGWMQREGPPRLSFLLRVPVPFSGWFARQRGRRIHHVGRCPIPKKGTSHVLLGTLCWASGLFIRAMPPVMAFAGGSLGFLTPFPIQDWMKVLVPILGCMNEARRAGNQEGTAPQILHENYSQKEIPKRTDVVLKVPSWSVLGGHGSLQSDVR